MDDAPENLGQLLDRLESAPDGEQVAIGDMLAAVGERSFGAVLLVPGLIVLSPLSGIPGMPTTAAVLVILIAGQLVVNRKHFWLPEWILRRTVDTRRFCKALRFLRPSAGFIDRHLLRPRLQVLTARIGARVIAVICILVALTMPPLELVPMAATTAGAAISTLALSLLARDGVMLLAGIGFIGVIGVLALRALT